MSWNFQTSPPLTKKRKVLPLSDYKDDKNETSPANFPATTVSPKCSVSPISHDSPILSLKKNITRMSSAIDFPRTSTPTEKRPYSKEIPEVIPCRSMSRSSLVKELKLKYVEPIVTIIYHGSLSPEPWELRRAEIQKKASQKATLSPEPTSKRRTIVQQEDIPKAILSPKPMRKRRTIVQQEDSPKATLSLEPMSKRRTIVQQEDSPKASLSPEPKNNRRTIVQQEASPKTKKRKTVISTSPLTRKLRETYISSIRSQRKTLVMDTSSLDSKIKHMIANQYSFIEKDPFDDLLDAEPNNNNSSVPSIETTELTENDIDILREKQSNSSSSSEIFPNIMKTPTKSPRFYDLNSPVSLASESPESFPSELNSERDNLDSIPLPIQLSPMRSDDRELSVDSFFERPVHLEFESQPNITEHDIDIMRYEERKSSRSEMLPNVMEGFTKRLIFHKALIHRAELKEKEIDQNITKITEHDIDIMHSEIESQYISSTTSLFDIPVNWDLDYTLPDRSDITGSEDYSIVFERRYQKEKQRKQQKKNEEKLAQMKKKKERKKFFKQFDIDRIIWSHFDCDFIKFSIKPKDFYPDHFSTKKIYTFSMRYTGRHWDIKTCRLPDREAVLKIKNEVVVTDHNIKKFLEHVVSLIFRYIEIEKIFREERETDYFNGEDIKLNESELELFLSEEERKEYIEYAEKCEKGMMTPPNKKK